MNFAAKLLLGSMSTLVITSTAEMLYSYRSSQVTLREKFALDSESTAAKAADFLKPYAHDPLEVCRVANEIFQIQGLQFFTISRDSKVVCSQGRRPPVELDLSVPEESRKQVEQSRVYSTFASIECEKKNCRPYDLEIGISFASLDQSLAMIWKIMIRNTLSLLLGGGVFLLFFSAFVRQRLRGLEVACTKIKNGNLYLDLPVRGGDEIARVAAAMNLMSQNLREAAEERVRQNQVLIQSSKMSSLGEMAGGVAHEINNPLGIIKLVISQIQDLYDEEPFDKALAKEMTTKVIKTTERIAKIVQGLRSFSRDGSGDEFEDINAKTFIQDTLSLCSERLKNHGVQIIVEPIDETLTFQARGTEISQVLVNLLNNSNDAIDSMSEKWIKLSVQAQGDWLELRVTDSGKGIPPEIQKSLFRPFFTTKEIGKGTGLGLSISHGIVKRHGGELKIDNMCPNTSFVIRLPKSQEKSHPGKSVA